mgnify:FL=1
MMARTWAEFGEEVDKKSVILLGGRGQERLVVETLR